METDNREINLTNLNNIIDISSNYKLTSNNLEEEEIDFPFSDKDLQDYSIKQDYQSVQFSQSKLTKNLVKSDSYNDLKINPKDNKDNPSTNQMINNSNISNIFDANLNFINSTDKLFSKNSNNSLKIKTPEKLSNEKLNKTLELKDKQNNLDIDLESLCNSRGDLSNCELSVGKKNLMKGKKISSNFNQKKAEFLLIKKEDKKLNFLKRKNTEEFLDLNKAKKRRDKFQKLAQSTSPNKIFKKKFLMDNLTKTNNINNPKSNLVLLNLKQNSNTYSSNTGINLNLSERNLKDVNPQKIKNENLPNLENFNNILLEKKQSICNNIENEIVNDNQCDKLVRKILTSRNSDYLKSLNIKIKAKVQENEDKLKKEEDNSKKIKENLGLINVKSKLLDAKKEFNYDDNIPSGSNNFNKINKIKKQKKKKKVNTPLTLETTDNTLENEENDEDTNKDKKKSNKTSKLKLKSLSKLKLVKIYEIKTNNNEDQENINDDLNEKINPTNFFSEENNKEEILNKNNFNKNLLFKKNKSSEKILLKKNEKNEKPKINPIEIREKMQLQLEKEKIVIQERILKLKNCYTIDDWKRRNRVEAEKNIFICFNGYPDMRKALINRGWVENVDPTSNFFDFKCALSARNVDFYSIKKNQFVNHFEKNTELTRKVALSKNLRNLIWFRNIDVNKFYPRCYDLSDINDIENFSDDFKSCKAEAILKRYLNDVEKFPLEKVKAAMNILERKLKSLSDIIDIPNVIIFIIIFFLYFY